MDKCEVGLYHPIRASIIAPVLNEASYIQRLIERLWEGGCGKIAEILVVDGGSTDGTPEIAKNAGTKVLFSSKKGRAHQMNFGATHASGNLFYFAHGDSLPPIDYLKRIEEAVKERIPYWKFSVTASARDTSIISNPQQL